MPSATTGPGPIIEAPRPGTPLTVVNSRFVSNSQRIAPSVVEYTRNAPSFDPEKTAPGITVTAADCAALQPRPVPQTGGLGGSRVVIVCDPNLPRSERTFERQYRTECVRPPGPMTNAADTLYQGTGVGKGTEDARMGLGYINHDMTLMKNFSIGNGRVVQVRAEGYNVFNTTQYQGVNTTATFDFATGVQTNPAFGAISGVRANSNRVIQLGVRLTF